MQLIDQREWTTLIKIQSGHEPEGEKRPLIRLEIRARGPLSQGAFETTFDRLNDRINAAFLRLVPRAEMIARFGGRESTIPVTPNVARSSTAAIRSTRRTGASGSGRRERARQNCPECAVALFATKRTLVVGRPERASSSFNDPPPSRRSRVELRITAGRRAELVRCWRPDWQRLLLGAGGAQMWVVPPFTDQRGGQAIDP